MDFASTITARWQDRGDSRSYALSLILLCVGTAALVHLFLALDPVLMQIWGARSGWYLEAYRTWGAKIWRLMYRSTSAPVCVLLPLLWMGSAFLIQSGLPRDKAKVFNKLHGGFIIAASSFALLSLFGLLLAPLAFPR